MRFTALLIILSSFLSGCTGQSAQIGKNDGYERSRVKFGAAFVKHFPDEIDTDSSLIICMVSPEINKINLYLYEFDVAANIIDSLVNKYKGERLDFYNWKDTCLLVVHPNETLDPFDEELNIDGNVDIGCLKDKQPLPNFIDYQSEKSKSGLWLDSTFSIFVIESKSGNHSGHKMELLMSMPKKWGNGFSRGVALSKERATLVYWMIMW